MTSPDYNIWELSWDAPDWLEPISIRLLQVGVPPTAISKAFQVDVDAIKELQATLDVQQYGTAEIAEAMNFLMWRAYRDALEILDSAPVTQRTRFITTLLSRQSMILGKQSPEGMNRMRAELEGLIASVNVEQPLEPSIYATSEFNPVDGETDNPEEGS
jgi:hypothetical protein